jgi:hypothetical protein
VIPRQSDDRLDDDDFNSLNYQEDEDFPFNGGDDDFPEDHLLTEEYDDDELERRRSAYSDLKKNDKIFNNTYNLGLDTSDDEEEGSPRASSSEIKLDSGSPDYHMYDPEKFSESLDLKIVQRDIYEFIKTNSKVKAILGNEPDKKKFTKPEINELFEILNLGLSNGATGNVFINPIHVLDSISSLINMEYKKIFDQLTYDNKEILLVELNNKYGFLDNTGKNYKIF